MASNTGSTNTGAANAGKDIGNTIKEGATNIHVRSSHSGLRGDHKLTDSGHW